MGLADKVAASIRPAGAPPIPPPPGTNGATSSAQHAAPPPPPPAPPGVAAPPPSSGKTGPFLASMAEQTKAYVIPDGRTTLFLCASGGKYSFIPVDANGTPNGTPSLLDATTPVTPTVIAPGVPGLAQVPPTATAAPTPPPPPAGATGKGKKKLADVVRGAAAATTAPAAPTAGQAVASALPTIAPTIQTAISAPNMLFIDAIPNCIAMPLENFVWGVAEQMAKDEKIPDIRFPPDGNHKFAFGRWQGALAGLLRASPPKGIYTVRSGTPFADCAIEALAPLYGPGQLIRSVK